MAETEDGELPEDTAGAALADALQAPAEPAPAAPDVAAAAEATAAVPAPVVAEAPAADAPPPPESAGSKRRSRWGARREEDEPEGCLEPGENKIMLEFIGMDKEVAMLRRFS